MTDFMNDILNDWHFFEATFRIPMRPKIINDVMQRESND